MNNRQLKQNNLFDGHPTTHTTYKNELLRHNINYQVPNIRCALRQWPLSRNAHAEKVGMSGLNFICFSGCGHKRITCNSSYYFGRYIVRRMHSVTAFYVHANESLKTMKMTHFEALNSKNWML